MNVIKAFHAIIGLPRLKADKSVTIPLTTRELTPKEMMQFIELHGQECYVGISTKYMDDEELEMIVQKEISTSKQSHSVRVRNVLYLIWKQDNKGFDNFQKYYEWYMENLIESLKLKLEP